MQGALVRPGEQAERQHTVLRFVDNQFDAMGRILAQQAEHPIHGFQVAQDMVAQITPVFVAADPQHDHPGHDEQNDGQHGEQQATAKILARDIHGSRPGFNNDSYRRPDNE